MGLRSTTGCFSIRSKTELLNELSGGDIALIERDPYLKKCMEDMIRCIEEQATKGNGASDPGSGMERGQWEPAHYGTSARPMQKHSGLSVIVHGIELIEMTEKRQLDPKTLLPEIAFKISGKKMEARCREGRLLIYNNGIPTRVANRLSKTSISANGGPVGGSLDVKHQTGTWPIKMHL